MILITKTDEWSNHAGRLAKIVFGDKCFWFSGTVGSLQPFLPETEDGIIISFLSPWIIKPTDLLNAKLAINFHPGSTNYPGTGCYNFALHEESPQYGAVCHHMEPKVDTGEIIEQTIFPVFPNDTIETLKFRTMVAMLQMFHKQICKLAHGWPLPKAGINWSRQAFTRAQLNQLYKDFPNTRATVYPDAD